MNYLNLFDIHSPQLIKYLFPIEETFNSLKLSITLNLDL